MEKKKIGFIGLGKMGKSMAINIFKADFPLTVYDTAAGPVNELVEMGAVGANSPKEVGRNSEIVLLMVPDSPQVDAVVLGENGLLEGMRPGKIIIVMSTVEPFYVQRLGETCIQKGVKVIDSPVSGDTKCAKEGTLAIMAGGARDVFEDCRKVLEAMGKNIVHCGDILGSGEMVKVANNLVSLTTSLLLHEAMVTGVKFGVKAERLLEVFKVSSANCWMLEKVYHRVMKGDFTSAFDLDLALKDIALSLATAKALKIPLLLGSQSFLRYQAESASGKGKMDFLSAITSLEELAGVQVRSEKKE